jgi:hypothetical protein
MEGGRMDSVKASLQIMLRSLPTNDTRFNIVSFGSRHSSLWPISQIYSAESVEEASGHIDAFEADYGGTELRSALSFAFNNRISLMSSSENKTPTSVFVLTDGKAWNLERILKEITAAVKEAKQNGTLLRVFTLGVGNEVSMAMCEGIARVGNGASVYVAVSNLLKTHTTSY